MTRKTVPLIIEDHPKDYNGYPFITLIQYRNQHFLTIVDNATEKEIKAFVLDLCGPENVNEHLVLDITKEWWQERKERYPLSFEFSLRGMTGIVGEIYKTYTIDFVTRVIGPLPKFEMSQAKSIKRRRRKNVPDEIEVNRKILRLV